MASKFDFSKFDKFKRSLASSRERQSPALTAMFRLWGIRYLAFTKRRFIKSSLGGGDWKALEESTKERRRIGKAKGKVNYVILRDSGTLLSALDPNAKGNLLDTRKWKVRVGFGGPHKHGDGKATIADIAAYHNTGGEGSGRPPKRVILVYPDAKTRNGMLSDSKRAYQKLMRGE